MTSWTAPGTGALTAASRRLTDLAGDVRAQAAHLTAAATATGWRSTAAAACRARLADTGRDLLAAATALDHAAAAVEDHARVAARRAETLEHAAADAVATAAGGLLGAVLS